MIQDKETLNKEVGQMWWAFTLMFNDTFYNHKFCRVEDPTAWVDMQYFFTKQEYVDQFLEMLTLESVYNEYEWNINQETQEHGVLLKVRVRRLEEKNAAIEHG